MEKKEKFNLIEAIIKIYKEEMRLNNYQYEQYFFAS